MTNLSGSSSRQLLSRDRLLVGVPVLVAFVISAGLGWFVLRPQLERRDEFQTRVDELEVLQQELPGLKKKLEQAQVALRTAESQQAVLIDLIAGSDRIQTFLASLDQLSRATGVAIERYEPMAVVTSTPPPTPAQRRNGQPPPAPTDPLISLGYRKTSVAMQVKGSYVGLQRFLQRMELLSVLVESSDLNLNAAGDGGDDDGPRFTPTALSLRLSFYDRMPAETAIESDSNASKRPLS